jgi:hypothetical protein
MTRLATTPSIASSRNSTGLKWRLVMTLADRHHKAIHDGSELWSLAGRRPARP